MRQESRKAMLEILRRETVPALGCTEPVAAALCAAGAAAQLPGSAEKVELEASEYILKNAMNVGIPGVSSVGLEMACALGAFQAGEGIKGGYCGKGVPAGGGQLPGA